MSRAKSVVTMLLAVAFMSSLGASAQYPGGRPDATRGGLTGGQEKRAPSRPQAAADIGAPVQIQLDKLEDDLNLTPEQRGAWNAYADKILKFADDMTRAQFMARTASVPQDATAAQQLDQLSDRARNRMTAMEEIAQSGRALYAVLTTDQKKIADRRLVLPMLSLANGLPAPGMAAGASAAGR